MKSKKKHGPSARGDIGAPAGIDIVRELAAKSFENGTPPGQAWLSIKEKIAELQMQHETQDSVDAEIFGSVKH